MTPTLSICIRGWRPESVGHAVESALAQTFADLEVVVADDSGRCEEAVTVFSDARVRYHRNETRLGPSANAARALSLGRGPHLAMLNDDDVLLPTFAETMLRPFREHPDLGAVLACHYIQVGERMLLRRAALTPGRHDAVLHDLIRLSPVSASAFVFSREAWEEGERILPLLEPLPADLTIALRAAMLGMPFVYVAEPVSIWAVDDAQVSSSRGMRHQLVSMWEAFSFPDDPEAERLRHEALADAYVVRAAGRLRDRRVAEAQEDLGRARAAAPHVRPLRRRSLALLARRPELIGAADRARGAYRRVRPYSAPWLRTAMPVEPK